MNISLIHEEFGAEIRNIDLSRQPGDDEFSEIVAAVNKYSLLIFRDQDLDDNGQMTFSRMFGSLEEEHTAYYSHGQITYMGKVGNIDDRGEKLSNNNQSVRSQTGNQMWHSDSSFREVPSLYSLLYAHEVPKIGGDTEFTSARAAYERLDDQTQNHIEPLIGIHDYIHSRTRISEDAVSWGQRAYMRPVRQRLIRKNPVTGQRNLYLGSHVKEIEGLSGTHSRELINRLMSEITRDESIYRHQWRKGDFVL
ncbi:MAG: hypothetical protein GKR95_04050 [Gammaproteobacteria bacterium]|nr:hypothetical protein [Gammaproteobacteria bacterium]